MNTLPVHQMNQIHLLTVPNSKSHKMPSVVEHVQFHQDCNNHGCEITGLCWQSPGHPDMTMLMCQQISQRLDPHHLLLLTGPMWEWHFIVFIA